VSDIETLIDGLTKRQRHEFALACARRVGRLITDWRFIAALDNPELWLRGEATDAEMAASPAEAWDADVVGEAASWWAARAAATAADTAWSSAWNAERAWQRAELERMLGEGGGA